MSIRVRGYSVSIYILILAMPCLGFARVQETGAKQDDDRAATFVIRNAQIITMDERLPRAEALAARGEWIIAVGEKTRSPDSSGRRRRSSMRAGSWSSPDSNDSHAHFSGGCRLLRSLNLYGVDSLEMVLSLVKQRVDQAKPGEWITGSRYDHNSVGKEVADEGGSRSRLAKQPRRAHSRQRSLFVGQLDGPGGSPRSRAIRRTRTRGRFRRTQRRENRQASCSNRPPVSCVEGAGASG